MGRRFSRLVCAVLAALASGCGGDGDGNGALSCIEGMSVPCPCLDGSEGLQVCGPSGSFEPCQCSLTGASTGLGQDGAGGAGTPATGSDGPADGGDTAGAGGSGSPVPPAEGSAPADGDGSMDAPGQAPPPADDGAGDGMQEPAPPPQEPVIEPPPPAPAPGEPAAAGELFGPCESSEDCEGEDSVCVRGDSFQVEQLEVGYCSAPCTDVFGTGANNTCPQPMTGDLAVSCGAFSAECRLAPCSDGGICPAGMVCTQRDVVRPPGFFTTVQECVYPTP